MPSILRDAAEVLPFRFGFSVPIELMTQHLDAQRVATLLGGQLAWAIASLTGALLLWRAGVRKFESVGG